MTDKPDPPIFNTNRHVVKEITSRLPKKQERKEYVITHRRNPYFFMVMAPSGVE